MKKVLSLFLATIFSLSLFAVDFSINLYDSYGDGWNGGMVDVTVAGVLVLDDVTIDTGSEASYSFTVNDGDEVIVAYTPGSWSNENSYTIVNNLSQVIYESPAPPEASYSFTAEVIAGVPGLVSNPVPANGSVNNDVNVELTWDFGENTETYDLYFGAGELPTEPIVIDATAEGAGSFMTSDLEPATNYYWQVVAKNSGGTRYETAGPVWMFQTELGDNVIQIGVGEVTNAHLPIESFYGYTYSQTIYTADQFPVEGQIEITNIRYNYSKASTDDFDSDDWVIYMATTAQNELTDWLPISEFTEVFNGNVNFGSLPTGEGWLEIELSSSFSYNPNTDGNLVIAVDENTDSYTTGSDDFYVSTREDGSNVSAYFYSDSENPDPANPPAFTRAQGLSANYPNIRVEYSTGNSNTMTYQVLLYDTYGDGWDVAYGGPNLLDVTVDGTVVLDDIYLAEGTGPEAYDFEVSDGSEVVINYAAIGNYTDENYYEIVNEEGVVIYTSTAPPADEYSFVVGAFEAPNVFFSEYIEGSSNNKAMEIYNGTEEVIDLSNYRINQSNNGDDWEYIHTFPEGAMLAPGDVWVIATDQLDPELFPLGLCDEVLSYPSVVHYNGNDARGLEVFANGEWNLIDVIGIPTSADDWDVAGVTEATKNHTIVRKDAVISGNTDWTASAGTNTEDSEWIVYDQNTFDYLGWHIEQPAYVAGTVTIDALGDITETIITIGDVVTFPAEDGTYIAQVEPGTYTVEAYLSGYEMASQADVVCVAGETTLVDFALNVIPEDLWPPVNLTAEIAGNDVDVAWTAPTQYGWNGYYDGPASLTWAGPERAVYFDVTDFGFSYPMELSSISHAFYEHSSYPWGNDTTFIFKIYGADGTTVLYESAELTALQQWDDTILELETPITVTENFYVSVVPTGESGFPSSLFDSDEENIHGYVGSPGNWGEAYADFSTMVYIVGEGGPEVLSYRKDVKDINKISSNSFRAVKRNDAIKIDERAPIDDSRDLLSFNVFRDDVQINTTPIYDVAFTDVDVPAGTHSYYATAVWNAGESAPSNVATVNLNFGNLAGNVSDGDGVEGAVISAGEYSAITDENGDFLIENMLIGTYDVSCSAVGYENPEVQTVEILAGETTTVNFVLESSEGTIAFFDDFESGAGNWTFDEGSTWGITDEGSHSPTHSMTESPNSLYSANQNISATLATPWDLSGVYGAELSFWYKSDIETAFDYMYLEVSTDNENWEQLAVYDEEDGDWQEEIIPMGGFVGAGYEAVSIRFRFESDGGYETVGMLIDDVTLTTYDTDVFEPFISHSGPEFYEGTQEEYEFTATIIDISGVAEANVIYTVDGGEEISAPFTSVDGNEYTFVIPAQEAGAEIDYAIEAIDAAATANTALKGVYSYIAGTHFIYDNGVVDFYTVINEGTGVAEKIINPPGNQLNLAYALIRNYTDQSGQDNDDFEFHVWADNNGVPGEDIIDPFVVTPEASYENTSAMTRIDLRPYADELNNIQGNFYIGFLVNQQGEFGKVHCTLTDPGNFSNSYSWNGAEWAMLEGKDLHFRAVAELIEVSTGMVEGTVTDINGDTIQGASVFVGTAEATTDENGYYSLVADPGVQDVLVHADSYIDYTGSIEVIPNDTVQLDVELGIILWAPVNLTYDYNEPNVILHWEEPAGPPATEFRYDDGVATAQLGFGANEASVLGGAHFYNAVIEEVSWMLTSNAAHPEAKILIFGLDAAGVPDDSQLLHESELLPNIDDQWNTYTLDTPVEAPNGFFVGVCTPGVFTAIGTDDGVGEPYEFQEGTQWGIADYTAGTNEWLDVGPAGFPFNFTIRAIGQNNGEINYARTANTNIANSRKLKYSELSTGIELGLPVYNNYEMGSYTQNRSSRSLAGYNIYRNDVQLNDAPHNSLIYVDPEPIEDCTYYVTAVYEDPDGESEPSNSVTIVEISADDDLVLATELQGNYPNPFNPTTTIQFSLLNPGKVNLKIYNAKGQVVRTLIDEEMESANYQITWNGTDDNNKKVSSGIYFYRMITKGFSATKKMMLLK